LFGVINIYLKGGVVSMNFFKEPMLPSSSPGGNKPDCACTFCEMVLAIRMYKS
jgi:hypothetical protein